MTTHVWGIGTDLVATRRFDRLIQRSGRSFLERWFTPGEVEYCLGRHRPGQHAAARFAAKEAVLKALHLAEHGPLAWRDIEVVRDHVGRPGVRLHGTVMAAAARAGVRGLEISISHDSDYATASAIAFGASGEIAAPARPDLSAGIA